jgi:flagellar M-ring protein FliF
MTAMGNFISAGWNRAGGGLRLVAVIAATGLLAAVIWTAFQALRPHYGVLFTELAPADAAVIVGRLKRDKVPYRLADAGQTVEVPAARVHEVRLGPDER